MSDEDRLRLFSEVAAQISRALESESHERTISVALDMLARWLRTIQGAPLPDKILDIFKVCHTITTIDIM